jgi:hypothetical protein
MSRHISHQLSHTQLPVSPELVSAVGVDWKQWLFNLFESGFNKAPAPVIAIKAPAPVIAFSSPIKRREPSGNLADAEETVAEDKPSKQPTEESTAEVRAKTEPVEEMAPLIPRKRGRKAVKECRNVRQRSMEPEQPPIPRLTRAAIKAEEEAQDTMDVLMALTGINLSPPPQEDHLSPGLIPLWSRRTPHFRRQDPSARMATGSTQVYREANIPRSEDEYMKEEVVGPDPSRRAHGSFKP